MQKGKLRLNVEELSVESFAPSAQVAERGTVRGAEVSVDAASGCFDCSPSYGEPASCAWTQCANISCLAGPGCGGNNTLARQETCTIQCNPNPPIE
jgi:hypothetical protein